MTTAAQRRTLALRPGGRVERLRASRSYGFVLALVLVSIAFIAFAPSARWSWSVFALLQVSILVAALWTSGLGNVARGPALVFAVAGVLLAVAEYSWMSDGRPVVGLFNIALILGTCTVIALGISDQHTINAQSVLGVITIYLLIGVLFTFAFSTVAALGSEPFFAQGTDGTISDRIYFSYVTLATLGYGDFTPATTSGRMLAAGEAIFGQLYLVTVVAVVVSRLRPAERDAGSF
jgi:hypothetical protein